MKKLNAAKMQLSCIRGNASLMLCIYIYSYKKVDTPNWNWSTLKNIYKFCNTENLPHADFTKNTNFCLCCMNSRIWVLLATTITVFTSAVFYKLYSTSLLYFPSGPPKKKWERQIIKTRLCFNSFWVHITAVKML